MMSFSSPHAIGKNSVSRVMITLLLALVPGFACLIIFFSWAYAINLVIGCSTALIVEAAILKIRNRPVVFFLKDSSALVTAALLVCAMPPLVPWWFTMLGSAIAIVFGKQLFGGLGNNPFNPAMVAYALLLISLPVLMTTRWANVENPSTFMDAVQVIFGGATSNFDGATNSIDALTGATPLDYYKLNISRLTSDVVMQHPMFGHLASVGWTPVNIAFLVGGCALLALKIITWHIPLALLGTLTLMALLFSSDADAYVPLSLHLLSGSTMLAAFFIATDPVSAATSNKGKIVFGIGIGILIYLIRTWGNYPDATAFAVLLMNFAAPLIDHYTRPRAYGHKKSVKGFKHD